MYDAWEGIANCHNFELIFYASTVREDRAFFYRHYSFKKYRIMKELISMFVKDYKSENFTWKEWAAAAVICITLVAIMAIAGTIESPA